MTTAEKGYSEMICHNCNSGLLYSHPEFHDWIKCELCGYCRKIMFTTSVNSKMVGHDD